jgi:hypothetical protein
MRRETGGSPLFPRRWPAGDVSAVRRRPVHEMQRAVFAHSTAAALQGSRWVLVMWRPPAVPQLCVGDRSQ